MEDIYGNLFYNIFSNILKLIDYSYKKMSDDDVKFILNEKGRDSQNNMSLENSITNRFVTYFRKYKSNFNLNYLYFESEAISGYTDELSTKGFLDIKIMGFDYIFSNEANENNYFAFECKRIGKNNQQKLYVEEGINRFKNEKYSEYVNIGGMLGYLEVENKDIDDLVKKMNSYLEDECLKRDFTKDIEYCYVSSHSRIQKDDIELYHLFFDFSSMIHKEKT